MDSFRAVVMAGMMNVFFLNVVLAVIGHSESRFTRKSLDSTDNAKVFNVDIQGQNHLTFDFSIDELQLLLQEPSFFIDSCTER